MSRNAILIAGQSGTKSTFAGGLYHHVEKTRGYSVVPTIWGDEGEFDDDVLDNMFGQGEYPDQTRNGYVAKFEIDGKAFSRPGIEVDIVDFPGEQVGDVLDPPGDTKPLLERIRDGEADDPETVEERFENDVRAKFVGGRPGPDSWETLFLHYYYEADKAIFLMNTLKTVDQSQLSVDVDSDSGFVYGPKELKQANEDFSDVAFVPAAVDWYGYDPASFDPGFVQRFASLLLTPSLRDDELMTHLNRVISTGSNPDASRLLDAVEQTGEIDLFSVSVPDRGTPAQLDGLLADDGHGGFEVNGFDEVITWLET